MRQVLRAGALGRPRGMGRGGRQEGGSGWGTHVNPWLIDVNVWQKPLQYCKVISLQLIKINGKKKRKNKLKSRSQSKIAWESSRLVLSLLQWSTIYRVPTSPHMLSLFSFPMNCRLYSPVCNSLLRLECMLIRNHGSCMVLSHPWSTSLPLTFSLHC